MITKQKHKENSTNHPLFRHLRDHRQCCPFWSYSLLKIMAVNGYTFFSCSIPLRHGSIISVISNGCLRVLSNIAFTNNITTNSNPELAAVPQERYKKPLPWVSRPPAVSEGDYLASLLPASGAHENKSKLKLSLIYKTNIAI